MLDFNPWQVDSIQVFFYLKCPECTFDTKTKDDFQDHAIENHPLSLLGIYGKNHVKKEIDIEENIGNYSVKRESFNGEDKSCLLDTDSTGGEKFKKCPSCESSFERMPDLKRHIASVHEEKRPHACSECNMKFKHKHHLKRHFGRAHKTQFDEDVKVKEELIGNNYISFRHI